MPPKFKAFLSGATLVGLLFICAGAVYQLNDFNTNHFTVVSGTVSIKTNVLGGSNAVWGAISGTIGDQSDLSSALTAKQDADADLTDLADGSLTGSKVGTGITADNITAGTLAEARVHADIARDTEVAAAYQPLDADLTDLADGTLTGSKVGTGVDAANIADGSVNNTEFQHLGDVTSAIQAQLDTKAPSSSGTRIEFLADAQIWRNGVQYADSDSSLWYWLKGVSVRADSYLSAGADLIMTSGNETTEKGRIDAATGNITTQGSVASVSGIVTNNLASVLSVGDTTFVDVLKASQTNSVSGALTFAHATNGVHGLDYTHVRWFFVPSGGPHTLTIPSGWRTNIYSAVPPALTNTCITKMIVTCIGPTADSASQTNVYVSFEYFK